MKGYVEETVAAQVVVELSVKEAQLIADNDPDTNDELEDLLIDLLRDAETLEAAIEAEGEIAETPEA